MSLKSDHDIKKNEMTFLMKFKHIVNNITIEPMLFCYNIPCALTTLANQNLYLEKACRVNLGYNETVCDALTARDTANYTVEEKAVQQLVVSMQGWRSIIHSLLPCLMILFWGSWSDRHGKRKPCMFIPLIGEITATFGMILNTYFKSWPMEIAAINDSLFPALSGGGFLMQLGTFSYMADITTEEDRTLRIGFVNLCPSVGYPIGLAVSGILLKLIGFYGIFFLAAMFNILAFFYCIFYVKESPMKVQVQKKSKAQKKNFIIDFFDMEHIVETFRVAFKKGENQRRLRVSVLLIVVMVIMGPLFGEYSVFYLFTRYKFNWSEVEYSFFISYAVVVSLIGTLFAVFVFSKLLKFDDSIVGIIALISKITASFVYLLATKSWQFYVAPLVEFVSGSSFIAMRSIASKLVKSDELGKVNSLFGVAEGIVPLIYVPLYTQVYRMTINKWPGAFMALGSLMTLPAIFIFIWMYKKNKEDERRKLEDNQINENEKFLEFANSQNINL
ncbi:hypothetical protein PVAND_003070 [Polypedilum vanderplanki]|uniref:Major facilitator superfamily (MFS) profile domain-containing protein n=1 Tax=Polypedilum vanderplanki TaxID=319348 RepID=A0A9J6BTC6_POLVA|nr:hypothetical protein PVAND_003070 [Polypedilum vanderplanki]